MAENLNDSPEIYDPVKGVIVPVNTFFTKHDALQIKDLRNQLRFLQNSGIREIIMHGRTGEDLDTTASEKIICNEAAKQIYKPSHTIVGVTNRDLEEVLAVVDSIKDENYRGLMIQPGVVNKITPREVLGEIASLTDMPWYWYHNNHPPDQTKMNVDESIAYIREFGAAGAKVSDFMWVLDEYNTKLSECGIPTYIGNAMDALFDDLHSNVRGVISGPANVNPQDWIAIWRNKASSNGAIECIEKMDKGFLGFDGSAAAYIKHVLHKSGQISTQYTREQLRDLLNEN